MYIPPHFQIKDNDIANRIMKENSFATVISTKDGLPEATQLPLLLDAENEYLYGHFARPNLQWKNIENGLVLVVFQGPHCYISPSWYETKTAVPTWNYVSVQVTGKAYLINDEQELTSYMRQLVQQYEDIDSTYKLEEVDANYLKGLNKGIQAFKIKINKIEGITKLSQNHSSERQALVIQNLEQKEAENERKIAALMKDNLHKGN
ncbi:transcriptional regulator [Lottiidibacillus patelloidae]|uniref:Transcriptional regulator n=1 Tax=Lottiidibacillus patelloidae TaxID=2670334 RepID=A0A263BWE8_9BACI|nr:FMN-binding negative transcriptional regulator [Lottiidibacillus patelloidae]OZM58071.1 transcriptional regulator [Lottiidibacillus patelloidae]